MARKVGRKWKARNGRLYSSHKAAVRADRTSKVSPKSKASRKRKTKRRVAGRRR